MNNTQLQIEALLTAALEQYFSTIVLTDMSEEAIKREVQSIPLSFCTANAWLIAGYLQAAGEGGFIELATNTLRKVAIG